MTATPARRQMLEASMAEQVERETYTPVQIEAARLAMEIDRRQGKPVDPVAARIAAMPLPEEAAEAS